MWYLALILLCFFFAYKWLRWWLAATVLAAWMSEKNYAPPTEKDCVRLSKWVMRNVSKDLTGQI